MKKLLGLAVVVAVAFAFSVYAGTTGTTTEEVKVKSTAEGTTTTVKEKSKEVKEKETITTTPAEKKVEVTDVKKFKQGDVWKDTVKFEKYEANSDYIYVAKEDKIYRLKHKLSDTDKQAMMKKKKGDTVEVTSTYPLTNQELSVIMTAK